jgi:HSP20 family protein
MQHRKAYYNNCESKANRFGTQGEHPMKRMWKEKMNAQFKAQFNTPPVNVRETDNSYELYLFAPGYEKSDFIISLTDKVLNISVEEKHETEGNWKRQEYTAKGFVRQFELNEKTDSTAIAATYKNGVLILSLPKLVGFETERHEIEVD